MSMIKSLSMTNTAINTLGLVTSVASFAGIGAAGKAGAQLGKAGAKVGLGTAVKNAWSGASGLGKIGAVTGTLAKRGLMATGSSAALLLHLNGQVLNQRVQVSLLRGLHLAHFRRAAVHEITERAVAVLSD